MRRIVLSLVLLGLTATLVAQGGANANPVIQSVSVASMRPDGDTIRMSGLTVVLADGTKLTADEAVKTGKIIELSGHVRLTEP